MEMKPYKLTLRAKQISLTEVASLEGQSGSVRTVEFDVLESAKDGTIPPVVGSMSIIGDGIEFGEFQCGRIYALTMERG